MVRARLRSLERKLVLERADQGVRILVGDLVSEWYWAVEEGKPIPVPHDFVGRVIDDGFFLPTLASVLNYLEDCLHQGTIPDENSLFRRLLPGANI